MARGVKAVNLASVSHPDMPVSRVLPRNLHGPSGHPIAWKPEPVGFIGNAAAGAPLTRRRLIPDGRYLMLGDHRDESLDSRTWGLLERWRFEGRIIVRYFSYNRDSYRPFPFIREIRWSQIGTRPR